MKIQSLNELPHTAKYLLRINAEPRTLTKAVVREEQGNGYWRDLAFIKFDKKGGVSASLGYEPSSEEQEKIALEFSGLEWPENVFINLSDPKMPKIVTEAAPENVFHFRDVNNNVIMIQVRQDKRNGKKTYIPITKWSDDEFRFLEPEGDLPLFGLENIKDHSTVIIVEGAKTARYVQWLSDGKTPEARKARDEHPWGAELSSVCVLGWCSGALSPGRVDWTPIQKYGITRAYVALDHDQVGREALKTISKSLRCVTHSIEFTDDWKSGADLYDPFPDHFFKEINGRKYYIGPAFNECVHPSTWMTDIVPNPDDPRKTMAVLRHNARGLWHYIEESEQFCYVERPDIIRKPDSLDAMLRPFCDVKKISDLLYSSFNGRITNFEYSPDTLNRRITVNGKPSINLYIPSHIKPKPGNVEPWLEFLDQLFPIEKERHLVKRWIATLYARPEVRMIYALLLVSQEQGTGKSSLGNILANLVGFHNTSFPSESAIGETYNSWLAKRRLIVCNEIYSGHSFKMFNKLKDLISEPTVTLREMYKNSTDMQNWAHFIMCSNSFNALKLDERDRRIFAPTVTETRWPNEKWDEFYDYLESGGYQIIADWCMNFGDYVRKGERAPMTSRKQEMIESSKSDSAIRCEELAGLMNAANYPVAVPDLELIPWLKALTVNVYERPLEIRKIMKKAGAFESKEYVGGDGRISYNSRMQIPMLNKAALDILAKTPDNSERKELIRSWIKKPSELMQFEN